MLGHNMNMEVMNKAPEWQQEADEFLKVAYDFKLGRLPTESPNPKSKNLSSLVKKDLAQAYDVLKEIDLNYFKVLEDNLAALSNLKKDIAETLESGGRIFLCGCGATGRLSLALERIWREDFKNSDQVISFMAGGDLALISSIEKFEDYPEYGARQLTDLGFTSNDLLIGSSEGGETPWVIGAVLKGRDLSMRAPYFLYCNPDEILIETVKRSKDIIEDSRVKKINLFCGEMGLTGSTRMQASSILMFGIGLCLLNYHREDQYLTCELETLRDFYKKFDIKSFTNFTKAEAQVYLRGEFCHYLTDSHLGISILTDTTERSPTFSLRPFENYQEDYSQPGLCYLSYKKYKESREAWKYLLGRKPRALSWSEVEKIAGEPRLYGYEVGSLGILKREKNLSIKPNHYFEVFLQNKLMCFSFGDLKLDVNIEQLTTLSQHLLLKMILNIHSTTMMGLMGRYESNIMTFVRASNNKLIDRTARNVAYLLGDKASSVSYEKIIYSIFKIRKNLTPDEPLVLRVLDDLS
jgi:N-acetylmuramic acid 6-phosphate etherase